MEARIMMQDKASEPEKPANGFNSPVTSAKRDDSSSPGKTRAKAPAAEMEKEKEGFHVILSAVGKVFRILLTPVIWVLKPLIFRVTREGGVPKVYFTSFSTLLYLWPIAVVGWVGSWMVGWGMSPAVMGWIWITVVLLVLLCIGADTDRNKTIALVLIVLLLWTSGLLLEAKKDIPVLSHIYSFFAAQNVQFERGTARVLSIGTFIVLIFVVIGAWFDGRYEITTREITHRRLLRTSDSLPRAAKRIKRDWRDLTELILGIGAGDLIVLDSNRNVVMRIANVPFLWFFRHDVDHILEVLAVTDADEAAAIEEDELD
jgi:hypothetical protein